jgi:hypothetical protein
MRPPRRAAPGAFAHVAFAAYCAVAFAAVVWPAYPRLGNRIEPFVLGLPFSLAWLIGWVLATLVALVLYDRAIGRGR